MRRWRPGRRKVVDGSGEGVTERIVKAAGGPVGAIIDLVNGSASAAAAFEALRKGGKLVQVGLFGGELRLPLPLMAMRALTVQGSYVGTVKDLRALVKLAQGGTLPAMPITQLPHLRSGRRADAAARRAGDGAACVAGGCAGTGARDMSQTDIRRSVVLRHRPDGEPRAENFAIVEEPLPQPGHGEVLTRTIWLSIDPYMRGRLYDRASYAPPVAIGGVMEGGTIGEVVASADPAFAPGDVVVGSRGWQTHTISKAAALVKLPSVVAHACRPISACWGCRA